MTKMKSFMKKKKFYLIGILLVAGGVYFGQKILGKTETTSTEQSTTAKVTRGNISSSISATGTVETANFLPVTTSVNGIIKEVFVKEGDTVKKEQKIMEITLSSDGEESKLQAWGSYLSAKSSLEKAKTDLLSKESTLINAKDAFDAEKEQNSYQSEDERTAYKLAENTYLVAKAGYEQQQNSITQAEISLNKAWLAYQAQSSTIVAPDDGIMANILVVEGMDVTNSLSERTSTSVASIKKEGTPIISLSVSELDINKVQVGQKVLVQLDSVERKIFSAEVAGIDRIGATSSGVTAYTVIARFDESSDLVLPNMSVEGQIILEEKEGVLLVASSAISSEKRETFVTVLEDGAEKKVKVEIGLSDGTNTEIISGLKEGDVVVISALPTNGFSEAQSQGQNQRGSFSGPGMFMR
jgi:RND family efflux transporter MFP subunit